MHPTEIESLIDQMTLDEQVLLLSGEDFWSVPAIARLGIGKLRVTDGPNGARGGGSLIGGVKSASFPVGIALGASWNTDLVGRIGAALAEEVKSKGAHMLLAPTVNIHRSVTNGRNFECYSEDPILSAELAAAYVRGLQDKGVGATVKHFAGNESEIERTTISSQIDERTLREVYLVPFEWAVKKAGAWGVMTAYNKLNGTFASEHSWLLETVLRKQWGYSGIVMSDWFGSHTTAETVNAGLDLEMPGPTRDRGEKLVAAVEAGAVAPETIRERVRAMLTAMDRTGALSGGTAHAEKAENRPGHRALIRRAGAEAMVLLKNENVLPLARTGKIAVIGPNAKTAQIMGGGSAQLNPHYKITPWEGLAAAVGEARLSYAQGCTNHRFEPTATGAFTAHYFTNRTLSGDPVFTETLEEAQAFWIGDVADGQVDPLGFSARISGQFVPEVSGTYRVGVYSAGLAKVYVDGALVCDAWSQWTKGRTYFEEGCDEVIGTVALDAGTPHEIVVEFATKDHASLGIAAFHLGIGLPLGDEAIAEAAAAAEAAETALVFVGRNGQWDTEGSDLASIALPGAQDALVAAVARANPRTIVVLQTGGPVEMPWINDVAGVIAAWYPGQEAGNAIADVLMGHADPGGRLPQSFPVKWRDNPTFSDDPKVYPGQDGAVHYEEGVFVGYRHYDKHGIAPLFPFGFGLSYTTFGFSDFSVDTSRFEAEGTVEVSVRVTNTGYRAGACVVQLYVSDEEASLARPDKELKAFDKVYLGPGASEAVTFKLDARAFAFFDPEDGQWLVEPGIFTLKLGASSADLPLEARIERATGLTLPA